MAIRDTARALKEAEHAVNLSSPEQQSYAELVLAQAVALAGDTAAARRRVAPTLTRIPARGALTPRFYQLALAMIATGRSADALTVLERIEPRGAWLWSYLILPSFDPVRSDARFVRLLDESRPAGARDEP